MVFISLIDEIWFSNFKFKNNIPTIKIKCYSVQLSFVETDMYMNILIKTNCFKTSGHTCIVFFNFTQNDIYLALTICLK